MVNVLSNGDFENGEVSWQLFVAGGTNQALFSITNDAYAGTNAGLLQVTSYDTPEPDGYVSLQNRFPAVDGKTYVATLRYKSTVPFRVFILNQGGTPEYFTFIDCPASAVWATVSLTANAITVPSGSSTWIDIRPYMAGDITIDDVLVDESGTTPTCPTGYHWDVSIGACVADTPSQNAIIPVLVEVGIVAWLFGYALR